ncbi:MAG: 3-phosphoshikimate 1-carboxyvinyltransferase [Candidatus Nezhaarchaeota archaeon]|nr:3-phosphoshikimate 1-carboxyvinyltransferase [Candidatus Nezhaarchaeota archaeon]
MKVLFEPSDGLKGCLHAQPSKSYTQRYLAASMLSEGATMIVNPSICNDTLAMMRACRAFGSKVRVREGEVEVSSSGRLRTPSNVVNCGGSATAIRVLSAIAALAPGISVLTGNESLRRRPMGPMLEALGELGVKAYSTRGSGFPPVVVFGGGIPGGYTWVDGRVSSQYLSGLLFALPNAHGESTVEVKGPLESRGYVDLTISVLREFGVHVKHEGYSRFHVDAPQEYRSPLRCRVPGDYSSSSFILVACSLLPSHVKLHGLSRREVQPDRMIVDVLEGLGISIGFEGESLRIKGGGEALKPFEVDVRDAPDLAPPLVALACFCEGPSKIKGCRRLKFKESDRMKALVSEFTRIGAKLQVDEDAIMVHGSGRVEGGRARSWGDHRIAMALAVAGLRSRRGVLVEKFECVSKSYPRFLADLERLGGRFRVVG